MEAAIEPVLALLGTHGMVRQRFDRTNPLRVQAEVTGEDPTPWAWAIYRGAHRFLIARSQPEYRDRAEALAAGIKAAETVGRRLLVEVTVEGVR